MDTCIALAHVVDSRVDFYEKRRPLVEEELAAIGWLRDEFHPIESGVLKTHGAVHHFAQEAVACGAQALIIHFPIWGDPIFSVKLANHLAIPILLLGNSRPETSSLVGMLGAGGALDQVGRAHFRVFNHATDDMRRPVRAFIHAATALQQLKGQTLVLFGGRSLGIVTAVADPAQWQRLFGVDIEYADQDEIIHRGESLPKEQVDQQLEWYQGAVGSVTFQGDFTPTALERQVRSYIATSQLADEHDADFIGVKCQSELSDGYVTQCVAHMLMNGTVDGSGSKPVTVHACESDADGALTMQILNLVSSGKPAGLLDIRWFDARSKLWTLANCGAIPAALCATATDPAGLSCMHMQAHVFGRGGGGAITGTVSPQVVTLARLCRKNGQYWMAIVRGNTVAGDGSGQVLTTPAFPKAFVKTSAGEDFLAVYGSNHIHLVAGDYTAELVAFCQIAGIEYRVWE